MFYVYLIKSKCRQWYYVGITTNPQKRLIEHNRGVTKSTKAYKPYELVYTKKFSTRVEARDYEKYLKIRSNKEKLLKLLN